MKTLQTGKDIMEAIQKDTVATVRFSLQTIEGALCDEAESFTYIHGHNNLLSGMENALEGKSPGDEIRVEIPPEDAFGPLVDQPPVRVHRKEFGPSFDQVREGQEIPIENFEGDKFSLFVQKKEGSYVTLGFNHPLAGKRFLFLASVLETRLAHDQEKLQGRALGKDI